VPSPKGLRLPAGVLVRVDVLLDERGHIQVFTRERLTPGWGGERNHVADLLFRNALDVLEGFREVPHASEVDDAEEGEDEGIGQGPAGPDGPRPQTPSLGSDLRLIYR
jgi:hypothetical protein